jgi:hypothetical protein
MSRRSIPCKKVGMACQVVYGINTWRTQADSFQHGNTRGRLLMIYDEGAENWDLLIHLILVFPACLGERQEAPPRYCAGCKEEGMQVYISSERTMPSVPKGRRKTIKKSIRGANNIYDIVCLHPVPFELRSSLLCLPTIWTIEPVSIMEYFFCTWVPICMQTLCCAHYAIITESGHVGLGQNPCRYVGEFHGFG